MQQQAEKPSKLKSGVAKLEDAIIVISGPKVASHAALWYNTPRNLLSLAMLVTSQTLRQTLLGGSSMDSLSPHADSGNSPEKRCTGPCGRTLPATPEYFTRHNRKENGLAARCKACTKIQQQAWAQSPAGRESLRKAHERYRQSPQRKAYEKAYAKDYYQRPEVSQQRRAYARAYRKRNIEQVRNGERNQKLRRNYNLTPDDYQSMFEQQMGLCAICGKPETRIEKQNGKLKSLAVDHCHKTGLVRELLCNDCNIMLAFAHDDVNVLKDAIKYLEKHSM